MSRSLSDGLCASEMQLVFVERCLTRKTGGENAYILVYYALSTGIEAELDVCRKTMRYKRDRDTRIEENDRRSKAPGVDWRYAGFWKRVRIEPEIGRRYETS